MLRCSGHGGGEVAAARSFGGGVAMEGSPSAMAKGGGEFLGDAWKPRGAGGGAGRAAQSGRRAAHGTGGEREQRETDTGRRQGPKRNFQNFRDLSVKH